MVEIDLNTWKVKRLITAGSGADGLAWAAADNLMTPAGALWPHCGLE